jgi:rhamnosyltransferase
MEQDQQNIDFWGITDYVASNIGMPGTHGPIPYHIQSYFLCFNNKVIQAQAFRNFWEKLKYEKNVKKVIQKYETQLTSVLNKNGYKSAVYLKSTKEINNYIYTYPDLGIMNSLPFLKIKAFLDFIDPEYILQLIQNKTNYPISFILDYFFDVYNPSVTLTISDKTFSLESLSNNEPHSLLPKIAVHLHVFYIDVFEKYVAVFDNWTIKYHLFITTDTPEKKQAIIDYLQNHPSYENLEEIIILKNHGLDILPWLSIADKLNAYDIIGHFYTNEAPSVNSYISFDRQQDIFDLLLRPINAIVDILNNNKKIGVIIPDIPCYSKIKENEILNNIWQKLNCKKLIDFNKISMLIFPYDNMFWYRPSALRPLFNLQLKDIDIPEEPLSINCILHAIERLPVYIAWSQGFDYRISAYNVHQVGVFHNNVMLNNYLKRSRDYKVGRLLLTVPRLIKRIVFGH